MAERTDAEVLGANVRRLRGEHKLFELARCAQVRGLRSWTTGTLANVESGRGSTKLPTVYALTLALGDMLGRAVVPAELFEGDPVLQSVVSDRPVRRPRADPIAEQQRAFIERVWETWPDRLQKLSGRAIHRTRAAMVEADTRIGKSMDMDVDRTAAEMTYLWGKPLSAKRDEIAGPGANQQARGQITRQLKAELQKVVADGDD